jgi:hypothetical protein
MISMNSRVVDGAFFTTMLMTLDYDTGTFLWALQEYFKSEYGLVFTEYNIWELSDEII